MILNTSVFRNSGAFNSIIRFTTRIEYFIVERMDESIRDNVTRLLQRLNEAERRAKLLQGEIKDIRKQISCLTQSANSILSENGPSSSNNILRNAHTLATSSTEIGNNLKRVLDESDSANESQAKRNKEDIPMDDGFVVVYTDGACENNGKPTAKAGIGVWFSENSKLNISEPVTGRATNNTAEIQAPTEALKVIKDLGYNKAKILTDSQFTINCMTKWISKWKKNQWKLANGGPVKNKEDLVKLDSLCSQFQKVKWEYCAGHKGIQGNEAADKLARAGAARYKP